MTAAEAIELNTDLWTGQAVAAAKRGDFLAIANDWVARIRDVSTGRAHYLDAEQADLGVLATQLAVVLAAVRSGEEQG